MRSVCEKAVHILQSTVHYPVLSTTAIQCKHIQKSTYTTSTQSTPCTYNDLHNMLNSMQYNTPASVPLSTAISPITPHQYNHICNSTCIHNNTDIFDSIFNSTQQHDIPSTSLIPLELAVPKRKTTPRVQRVRRYGQRQQNSRREHQFYRLCLYCQAPLLPHHACMNCKKVYPKKQSSIAGTDNHSIVQ
jgi:ribosomal protein L32